MSNYFRYLVYLSIIQSFLFGTCAPIPVHYVFVNNEKINDTTVSLNMGKQSLVCRIDLFHYPSKTISSYSEISFQNNSADTIFFNKPVSFISNDSIIISKEINSYFLSVTSLNPFNTLRISASSNPNFEGNIRELLARLKNDSLQIVLNYSANRIYVMNQTFTLKLLQKR